MALVAFSSEGAICLTQHIKQSSAAIDPRVSMDLANPSIRANTLLCDCTLPLRLDFIATSSPTQSTVQEGAMFPDYVFNDPPIPTNSADTFWSYADTHFGSDHGISLDHDMAITLDFHKRKCITPDTSSDLVSSNSLELSLHTPCLTPILTPIEWIRRPDSPNTIKDSHGPRVTSRFPEVSPGRSSRAGTHDPVTGSVRTAGEDSIELESRSKDKQGQNRNYHSPDGGNYVRAITARRPGSKQAIRRKARVSATRKPHDYLGGMGSPTLKSNTPAEERCIIESRWRHRDKKGQNMWDKIQADYFHEFGKEQRKETLQMKLLRARRKYILWHSKDAGASPLTSLASGGA